MPTLIDLTAALNFETIFAATASPCLVLNRSFQIIEANNAYLRATAKERCYLLGKYIFDVFQDNPQDPCANGVTNLRNSLERVKQTRLVDVMPQQKYDIIIETAGLAAYEERYWDAVNTPVLDESGELTHIIHQVIDITSRVAYECALHESKERYAALVNAMTDVVYHMSPDWKQLYNLQGRGFIKDTLVTDKYWIDGYLPPEEHTSIHRAIDIAIKTKNIFALEHKVRRVDGSSGWAMSRAVPMFDEHGEIREWIGAATDITERKEFEEKLKTNDRQKDEFLPMLAHELRNPLAPISAAAELLRTSNIGMARIRQASHIISRQVLHMTHLIEDLLDVSRVTHGMVVLEKTELEIFPILMQAAEQIMPALLARRHRLVWDLSPQRAIVLGDEKRLVQVIANIISNAVKYTEEGGLICISSEVAQSHVLIQVKDNGIGMAPELIARAFDLFAQAERSPDRSSGGLGLGLSLVKNLIELHNGKVRCESGGPENGSTFIVCLPRLDYSATDIWIANGNEEKEQSDVLKIMVVDDNVDAAHVLAMLLEVMGHDVVVANGSLQALSLSQQYKPQVILLDIGLPHMDGNELAKHLRQQDVTSKALMIAITGYGQEHDRQRAFNAGFDHYLVKPVDTEQLITILKHFAPAT